MPLLLRQMLPLASARARLPWQTAIDFLVGQDNLNAPLQISQFLYMQSTWALQMLETFSTIELHAWPGLRFLTTHLQPCHMSQISHIL